MGIRESNQNLPGNGKISSLCQLPTPFEGDEGETQVPRLGEVPTSGAADHRQEQATKGAMDLATGDPMGFLVEGGPKNVVGKHQGLMVFCMFKQEEIGCFEMDMDLDGWDGDGWWVDDGS